MLLCKKEVLTPLLSYLGWGERFWTLYSTKFSWFLYPFLLQVWFLCLVLMFGNTHTTCSTKMFDPITLKQSGISQTGKTSKRGLTKQDYREHLLWLYFAAANSIGWHLIFLIVVSDILSYSITSISYKCWTSHQTFPSAHQFELFRSLMSFDTKLVLGY